MKEVVVYTSMGRDKFSHNAIVEDDGAIKWVSNGHYLNKDTMQKVIDNGFTDFSVEATNKKRDIQDTEWLKNYRKNYKGPNEEELFEMRAAFGPGKTIVNVLTGTTIRT